MDAHLDITSILTLSDNHRLSDFTVSNHSMFQLNLFTCVVSIYYTTIFSVLIKLSFDFLGCSMIVLGTYRTPSLEF